MKTISISDLNLASALLYLGFPIQSLDHSDPQRIVFHFLNESPIVEAIEAFHRGDISVEVKRYFACIKEVKNRIYSRV